jgi:hypothetical protein
MLSSEGSDWLFYPISHVKFVHRSLELINLASPLLDFFDWSVGIKYPLNFRNLLISFLFEESALILDLDQHIALYWDLSSLQPEPYQLLSELQFFKSFIKMLCIEQSISIETE